MDNKLRINDVRIKDSFWSRYIDLALNSIIPYQWEALNDKIPDAPPSYAIRNFRIAAGLEQGEFGGLVFQDSDLAKWLEAAAYSLEIKPDPDLEDKIDSVVELIEKAQLPDGYVNTYYILKEPGNRWTNLWECHELYCAGHMIEAAVAYYEATGKRKFLDSMCRFADHIDTVFGPEPEKLKGYPGHQEIELALVKLYRVTGNERYLRLAKFFIDERGKKPFYFDVEYEKRDGKTHWPNNHPANSREYNQYHLPVREQDKAKGHAVRAVYMYSGMADIAAETKDRELSDACHRIWDNIETKQMYITGGIGSTVHGEAFTFDYDLPNDTVYQETCASIGLIFYAQRMQQLDSNARYADVMERALYNSVLSGISMDGKSFFYVNPLEVWPEASQGNPGKHHVKPVRQKWYGCACCPPNAARLLMSLPKYIYNVKGDTIYTNLYIGNEANLEVNGERVRLIQETEYPWRGNVSIIIKDVISKKFVLALRKPGWCPDAEVRVNGQLVNKNHKDGYIYIERVWNENDKVEIHFSIEPILIQANPKVRANAGKAAIQYGPFVYCLEEKDNGANLSSISIDTKAPLEASYCEELLGGTVKVTGKGYRENQTSWNDNELYRQYKTDNKEITITAVPYCMWGNREPGEMLVWICCD